MVRCPNCGTENARTSKFCAECGTRLERPAETVASPTEPQPEGDRTPVETPVATAAPLSAPAVAPPAPFVPASPASTDPTDLPPTDPNWRMSPPEPYVPTQRRRTWLWIVGGVLGLCVLVCVGAIVWGSTIGRPTLDGWATQLAIEATRQADVSTTPAPATP